jgi:hypothetical protein
MHYLDLGWIDCGGISSLSSGGVWAMAPPTENPADNAIAKAARFITGPTLNGVS